LFAVARNEFGIETVIIGGDSVGGIVVIVEIMPAKINNTAITVKIIVSRDSFFIG
jgi:hypothetical protein